MNTNEKESDKKEGLFNKFTEFCKKKKTKNSE